MKSIHKTDAIIVTYNPVVKDLFQMIDLIEKQVDHIIIIDNASEEATRVSIRESISNNSKIYFHELNENFGIAKAQNVGIEQSLLNDPDFLIFFDQDSLPGATMVSDLKSAYLNLSNDREIVSKKKIGILGPRYTDPRQNNPPPFIKVQGLNLVRCKCLEGKPYVEVDYLISSGSLAHVSMVREVGPMREDFFIDYVDIEWGLRANKFGYQNFGICSALMHHSLGDNPKKFFSKHIPVHSPLRHYYHFRNAILIYKMGWVPINWKLVDGYRLILKFGFYTLFSEPRLKQFSMMLLGVLHGLTGRSGKL
ncbi:MAG: glycosyltransferase family 2 protein [Leptospira sp.]|nr:glycosyltransferase family 2 protein [Leptospira sp.]